MEDQPLDVLAKKANRILEQRTDTPGSVAAIALPANNPLEKSTQFAVSFVRMVVLLPARAMIVVEEPVEPVTRPSR